VRPKPLPRTAQPLPKLRAAHPPAPKPVLPKSVVARIVDDSERSLVDVIDNLLNQGVMLNADIIHLVARADVKEYRDVVNAARVAGVAMSGPWAAFAFAPDLFS